MKRTSLPLLGRREFNGDTAVAWPIAARAAVGDAGNRVSQAKCRMQHRPILRVSDLM